MTERAENGKEPNGPERTPQADLPSLVATRNQLQRIRIAEGNRTFQSKTRDDERRTRIHSQLYQRLMDMEHDTDALIRIEMHEHPAWPWLEQIRGVGEVSAAQIVGYIDITRCNTVSALWRYAGFAVFDGKRERPVKGEKLHYNAKLKVAMYRLTARQLMLGGPYEKFYRDARLTYTTTRTEWTKSHIHLASLRRASKMFLSHLWLVWRTAEGLNTNVPFIGLQGEGHDIIGPWEMTA